MKCLVNNSRAKRMKMRASVVSRYAQGKSHLRCIKVISALVGAVTNFQIWSFRTWTFQRHFRVIWCSDNRPDSGISKHMFYSFYYWLTVYWYSKIRTHINSVENIVAKAKTKICNSLGTLLWQEIIAHCLIKWEHKEKIKASALMLLSTWRLSMTITSDVKCFYIYNQRKKYAISDILWQRANFFSWTVKCLTLYVWQMPLKIFQTQHNFISQFGVS